MLRCRGPLHQTSLLRCTDPERDDVEFALEGITPATASEIARTLAPVRDVSAASATTGIPRVVNLFDLPGLRSPRPEALARRWSEPHPYGLLCELGIGPEGSFMLDLVAEGPHALVAGTSGAGKSELLQSLVLTLAARYSPQRLNFLFIDYKGGAGSAELGPLPHTVGSVTNLDERLALRALASLRAELRRRMAVLEGRAKDLADMLKVAPEEAPPSLVIVVDEFATLVKEIPDFVAGIVDIAQRGRSLGIHLVLATQRPTGAVSDNILANTNLRIALRVLDVADSKAVIDQGDAAGIPVPLRGRAFARTGPGALQPFQCAWSGAPHRPEEQATPVLIRSYPFSPADDEEAPPAALPSGAAAPEVETQLTALVRACREAAGLLQLGAPRRPWVEPLAEEVSLDDVMALDIVAPARSADPGRTILLGLGDVPEEQRQTVVDVDLEASGGLLIFGSGGAGKTTLLRTIAAGLVQQGTPDEVQLFVLDFGGRSLAQLEELPHVAATATSDDLEKVTRILTVLEREIERRRRILADARAESISALRARSAAAQARTNGGPLPRIVVLLDNYATFHATFEAGVLYRWITSFQALVTDGRQVGVHVVMTNGRMLGIPLALSSTIAARVVMRMATADEMVGIGVTRKAASGADLGGGRCVVPPALEVQAATVSVDPLGSAQAAALSALADKLHAQGTVQAPALEELPEVVKLDPDQLRSSGPDRLRVGLGLADLTLDTVSIDLARQNLVVLGPPLSGRSSALAAVADALVGAPDGPRLIGLGGLTSPLARLPYWDVAGFGRSKQLNTLAEAAAMVDGYEGDEVKLVLVIDSAEDFESLEYGMTLEPLVRSEAVRVVVTAEVSTLERAYSGWMAEFKRNRAVLMLQPESPAEVESVTRARPAIRPGQSFPAGRGVLVDHGVAVLMQVRWALGEPLPKGVVNQAGSGES
jgi:S-DNA-T family DNA segregation ATPase FtsK/SpoIIIE